MLISVIIPRSIICHNVYKYFEILNLWKIHVPLLTATNAFVFVKTLKNSCRKKVYQTSHRLGCTNIEGIHDYS